jgi:alcohol dehydrogenase class IV
MRFEFATAARICFGAGVLKDAGSLISPLGRRALVCSGIPEGRAAPLVEALSRQGIAITSVPVLGEPTVAAISQGIKLARQQDCDLIIGLGGGSAIDTAKAVAALSTNPGDIVDYLEVVGKGQPLKEPPLPWVAIPTTAGTGAEVTRNAVIGSPEHNVKVSLRSPLMLTRLALVDPEMTYGLPPEVTASTGLDALTQLIEPYVSIRANPLVDAFCREGIGRAARSLRHAYDDDDPAARQDMALASLLGGLALANAGLGAVHGFAGVLGGVLHAPHGAICARLLPYVMAGNLKALMDRHPDHPAIPRYQEIAQWLTGRSDASATDGIGWILELCAAMNIPALSAYGLTDRHLAVVVEKTLQASSTKANPLPLHPDELAEILESAL